MATAEDGDGRGGEGRWRTLLDMLAEVASVTDRELDEANEVFERAKLGAEAAPDIEQEGEGHGGDAGGEEDVEDAESRGRRMYAESFGMGHRNPKYANHMARLHEVRMRKERARLLAPKFARPNEFPDGISRVQQHHILQSINARLTNGEPRVHDPMASYTPLALWSPCRTPDFALQARSHRCPSLITLTIASLVQHLAHLDALGPYLPESLKIDISAAVCARNKMDARVLAFFFRDGPSIIRIPNCTLINDIEFIHIFRRFSPWEQLKELHLGLCGRPFTDECVRAFVQPKVYYNLKAITLHAAYRLTDKGLEILLKATPQLLHLNLGQCSNLTNTGIQAVAFYTNATLKSLVVEDCGGLNAHEFVPNLLSMGNLHVLSLAKINGVDDNLVDQLTLGIGSQLEELSLAECSNLTDVSMSRIATRCPLLKKLNLKRLAQLTDDGLCYITNGSTMMLEALDVTMCKFSDEVVAAFVIALGGSLENLSVNHVNEVADHTLMALSKTSHASLHRLDASWCRRMSDDCLGFLVTACPHLTELRLIACTQLTARFLEGHNNPKLKLVV